MSKSKYNLSRKHEYLISKSCDIPSLSDIEHPSWLLVGSYEGVLPDYRYNTEAILMDVIMEITKGTQMEAAGREICDKANKIFEYYANKGE